MFFEFWVRKSPKGMLATTNFPSRTQTPDASASQILIILQANLIIQPCIRPAYGPAAIIRPHDHAYDPSLVNLRARCLPVITYALVALDPRVPG